MIKNYFDFKYRDTMFENFPFVECFMLWVKFSFLTYFENITPFFFFKKKNNNKDFTLMTT